jgi:hypothetical protein
MEEIEQLLDRFRKSTQKAGLTDLWDSIEVLWKRLGQARYDAAEFGRRKRELRGEMLDNSFSNVAPAMKLEGAKEMSLEQLQKILANLRRHLHHIEEGSSL